MNSFNLYRSLFEQKQGNLLKILPANVQSLSQKIDEFIGLVQLENFDDIALNETWLDTQN